jgi:hypothetical protein
MSKFGTYRAPATKAIIELRGIWIFDCGLKWSNKTRNTRAKAVHVTAFCYFQKKSKRGIATPKHEMELMERRLAQVVELEKRAGRT